MLIWAVLGGLYVTLVFHFITSLDRRLYLLVAGVPGAAILLHSTELAVGLSIGEWIVRWHTLAPWQRRVVWAGGFMLVIGVLLLMAYALIWIVLTRNQWVVPA